MRKVSFVAVACVLLFAGLAMADPSGNNVVLNEIYPNPSGTYDGAEFIELYNPTGSAIDISGWVLAGTEYGEICGGEDRWQFPSGTSIPAGGFIVVAKDGADGDDGFFEEFGFYPDFEFFDPSFAYDDDSALVDNMTLLDDDPATYYTDEITLAGGNGYGVMCRVQPNNDGYILRISGDGYAGIHYFLEGEPGDLVDWTVTPHINTGNSRNTIRVICDGPRLALFVNGNLVAEATDTKFTSGDIALTATTYETEPTKILYDNIRVVLPQR